jgi:cysteine desulfurase
MDSQKQIIYLDNNATTPIDKQVLEAMMPFLTDNKGVAENYSEKGKHIVTVATEHSAVLDTYQFLGTKGFEISYLPVKTD